MKVQAIHYEKQKEGFETQMKNLQKKKEENERKLKENNEKAAKLESDRQAIQKKAESK